MSPDVDPSADILDGYETVAYDARPNPASHPDHLAAIAAMFGLEAPDVRRARVLEVGCSNGANLLPVAAALPDARFVGCDLAPTPIAQARAATEELGLRNVDWHACDIRALPATGEPFDYVVAHGFYSWVPPPVRDALLDLAARRLAPNGVLFLSCNVYPGGHTRRAAAEILRHHTAAVPALRSRLVAARELAALLSEAGTAHDAADAGIREELRRIARTTDSELAHDVLAAPNDPVWFHELARHLDAHGLAYLAEAAPAMMGGAGLAPEVRAYVARLDRLAREQYLDFARLRRFRQSLACRADAPTDFALRPSRGARLHAMASMSLLQAADAGRLPGDPADPQGRVDREWLARLVAAAPATVAVAELAAGAADPRAPGEVKATLLRTWMSGFVQLRTLPLACAGRPGARPEAPALARWQAGSGDAVANLRHESIRLPDPFARSLLALLDGTRTRGALAAALAAGGVPEAPEATAERIDAALASFARSGLLVR